MPVFAVITVKYVANCTFSGAVVATFRGKYKQRIKKKRNYDKNECNPV